jgi:very-short-patch-repair endonuclease
MKKTRIRTSEQIQERARELRKAMTPAEVKLWLALRKRQVNGLKFRRQHPIGSFIVDFYCAEHRLVVEIDGKIHHHQHQADSDRSSVLADLGYRVIRFSNEMVENDIGSVLSVISRICKGDKS